MAAISNRILNRLLIVMALLLLLVISVLMRQNQRYNEMMNNFQRLQASTSYNKLKQHAQHDNQPPIINVPAAPGGDTVPVFDGAAIIKKIPENNPHAQSDGDRSALPELLKRTQESHLPEKEPPPPPPLPSGVNAEFAAAVKARARSDGFILIPAVIDTGYLDTAHNMYLTSIVRHNLTSFTLFLCVDKTACDQARDLGIPVFLYRDYSSMANTGDFATKTFKKKAMTKHYMIYDIISLGYSVLLSDLDMYWFKNPVDDVIANCGLGDFNMQSEAGAELNIGFQYVRPTRGSIAFYKKVTEKADSTNGGAQGMFNSLVHTHKKKIKYKVLSLDKYPDGQTYFEKKKHIFPGMNPCRDCYIAHNNWIVGTEAKIYRFKEHGMWWVDVAGYYSNPEAKYIVYDNPVSSGTRLTLFEMHALKDAIAIAKVLGRILIIPKAFHNSKNGRTPMNGILTIRDFDVQFKDAYRESTFLQHHLVPDHVKQSECGPFLIRNDFTVTHKSIFKEEEIENVFIPQDLANGATDSEIEEWFSGNPHKICQVIRFHSLYNAFKGFKDTKIQEEHEKKFDAAYTPASYRQLELLYKKKNK